MYILIVEDDALQYDYFKDILNDSFPKLRVERIITESEFRDSLEKIAKDPPDIILMDIMLRWTDPMPDMAPPPEDVKREGFFRAGLRCTALLAEDERTRVIPVILYSVLETAETELPRGVRVKMLDKDFDKGRLERRIREMLR